MLRSSTTSYYEADGVGSLTSLSNTAGALAQTYTFDSFGNTTASTGSITNSFRYTGRELDSETMLYFMRARYFDPNSGRFISEDPLRFPGGINFYVYAANSPTNFNDPYGFEPQGCTDCQGRPKQGAQAGKTCCGNESNVERGSPTVSKQLHLHGRFSQRHVQKWRQRSVGEYRPWLSSLHVPSRSRRKHCPQFLLCQRSAKNKCMEHLYGLCCGHLGSFCLVNRQFLGERGTESWRRWASRVVKHLRRFLIGFLRLAVIAICCAVFGAGIGFVQGEIVARGPDQIYQVTFGEGAAMIGAAIAFFLGPMLLYALNRQMLFERFCYIGVATLLTGCLVGWFSSRHANSPGWASMFVTPIAAIIFAVLFSREQSPANTRTPG